MEDIWFGIETKVRALIKDVLEPTIRRVIENKDAFDRVSKNNEVLSTRIDDLDSSISKYARKISLVDELSKKILEYDSMIRIMDVRFNRDREEIKAEVSTFSSKIINFEEYLNVFDHLKDGLRNDITNLTYALNSNKSQQDEKFEFLNHLFTDKIHTIENSILHQQVQLSQFEKTIRTFSKELGENTTQVQTTQRTTEDLNKKAKDIRNSYKYLKKNVYDSIEKLRLLAIKTMNDSQVADRKILELINSEVPVRNRIMVAETLFSVINDPFQRRDLAQVEKIHLGMINESQLNPDLKELLEVSRAKVEEVLLLPLPERNEEMAEFRRSNRRKTKQRTVFVVKKDGEDDNSRGGKPRRDSAKLDVPLQEIPEEQASPRSNEDSSQRGFTSLASSVSITQSVNRQIRKSEIINLRDYEVIKDELQIARFNSLIGNGDLTIEEQEADDSEFNSSYGPQIDYHPFIQEAKDELINLIEEVRSGQDTENDLIYTSISTLKEEVKQNQASTLESIQKSSAEGLKNLKELEIIMNQALAECTSAITMRKRDQSDFSFEIKNLVHRFEQVEKKFDLVQVKVEEVYSSFENIVESLKMMNTLAQQDEVDRESIALMGYKESKGKGTGTGIGKSVVSIDKQCLSCTGQASVVINAFKIACLAYAPSSVVYKESVFTRKELLEAQGLLLKSVGVVGKTVQINSILEEVKGSRCKTASNIRMRPLSVPTTGFTLQTPRYDASADSEFPRLSRRNRNLLNTSLQQ